MANNIAKHSDATDATLQIISYGKQVTIVAEDNGKGISPGNLPGIGLKNVETRVHFLNGNMNVDSGNRGTTIMIQIPYKETWWLQ